MKKIDLFVPGRLCLFGEHSDWAGEYRNSDKSILTGKCIVAVTDQGIYASAEPAESGFHVSQILPDGSVSPEKSYHKNLVETAKAGVYDSYAAGTAAVITEQYPNLNLGLRLKITGRDLPLKKGLSSSAATCVLVARAINRVHNLHLSINEEMEFAYRGELLTGSRCGRMDQVCAFERDPVLLTFDGDEMTAKSLQTGGPLCFLVVDLKAKKNTRKILEDLNLSFSKGNTMIRQALGEENHRITEEACRAIETGDARQLGKLMTHSQNIFDEMIAPECPSELTAPKLHQILSCKSAQGLAWGGKGVGSQGDGTAQFLCRGIAERKQLKDILEKDRGLCCYNLTL